MRDGDRPQLPSDEDPHIEDRRLADECRRLEPRALTELDRRLSAVVPRALASIRMMASERSDLTQKVREKLLLGEAPRIAQYTGRGPLDAWLRVVVLRAALDEVRKKEPDAPADEELDALTQTAAAEDPYLNALLSRCAPAVRRAVADALAALDDDDRLLLKLHYVDGLTIDELSPLLDVHRATAARRVARLRSQLGETVRLAAASVLDIDVTELESLVATLLSRLDISLGALGCDAPGLRSLEASREVGGADPPRGTA